MLLLPSFELAVLRVLCTLFFVSSFCSLHIITILHLVQSCFVSMFHPIICVCSLFFFPFNWCFHYYETRSKLLNEFLYSETPNCFSKNHFSCLLVAPYVLNLDFGSIRWRTRYVVVIFLRIFFINSTHLQYFLRTSPRRFLILFFLCKTSTFTILL